MENLSLGRTERNELYMLRSLFIPISTKDFPLYILKQNLMASHLPSAATHPYTPHGQYGFHRPCSLLPQDAAGSHHRGILLGSPPHRDHASHTHRHSPQHHHSHSHPRRPLPSKSRTQCKRTPRNALPRSRPRGSRTKPDIP